MSRIGKAPISIPDGVEVKLDKANMITVKGPKGTLERALVPQIEVKVEDGVINVTRPNTTKRKTAAFMALPER